MQPVAAAATDLRTIVRHGGWRRARRIAIRVALAAVAILAVIGVVQWWRSRHRPAVMALQTEAIGVGDLRVSVTATGSLKPQDAVSVGSEVSGRIKRILVEDNEHVRAGQTLAQIDTQVLAAQREQAEAVREQAAAQLRQARATQHETAQICARDVQLHSRGVLSDEALDSARAAAERAEAAVSLARANLRQATANVEVATTNLTKAEIRSPIDGIVLSHSVEEGQTVVAAFQTPVLFEIAADLRTLELSVDVDEADIGKVAEGQAATFTVAAYVDRRFDARVIKVHNASRIVDRVVSYEAELAVDNKDRLLRPGMTATAQIVVDQVRDTMLVPSQALRFTPPGVTPVPGTAIWIQRAGFPIAVPVVVVGSGETQTAIRTTGAAKGELVITNTR